MAGFKFTDDQRSALKLIGGMVRNLFLFGGLRSCRTFILLRDRWITSGGQLPGNKFFKDNVLSVTL
ncbi:MAG: hypothetical protein WCV67_10490 [Victivallaceae bacterium]|jgi:hypothetical protein